MHGVLIWGLLIGLPLGFLLTMWFNQRGYLSAPFWASFARVQDSAAFDLQFMFKETQQKIEELSREVARFDTELRGLQVKISGMAGGFSTPGGAGPVAANDPNDPGCPGQLNRAALSPVDNRLPAAGKPLKVLQYRPEIYRLYREGLPLQEIARRLRIRQGEVELVLSLKEYRE